ncbi:MAG: regulatory protein RecX [Pseudobdellovibrio sp.]|jgi:regulatory protein|nr:regulatory protein RecX [Pseudobdellovibrio sp.]
MSFYGRKRKPYNKENSTFKREPLTLSEAKKKLMDLVARRDHSEKELRKKLAQRCEPEVVEQTIKWAGEQNWLASPEKLKTQFAEQLSRRGKGIRKINQKLKELGLESVKAEAETELEKAKKLVLSKWSPRDFKGLDFKESQKLKAKIMRYLITRGYESHVVSSILKNDLKYSSANEEEIYDDEF